MKNRHFLLAFVLILSVTCAAFADRDLSRTEILQIFQQLTSQPKTTWLPAGTIEATHSEYRAPKITDTSELTARINQKITEYQNDTNKREQTEELQTLAASAIPFNVRYELANEYTMDTQVVVKYDGNKFYWEINVSSRNDSVKPETTLRANYMTNQFNLSGNARRIFVWDGEKYTNYFLPINQAMVDTTNRIPHAITGPLTAGIIPWGYGVYSYDNLAAASSTAIETTVDNQTQIQLTLTKPGGTEIALVLDPAKNNAVLSCITSRQDGSTVLQQYSNYSQVAGNWVPGTISLEQYAAGTNRLLSRDQWEITDANGDVPSADAFKIDFKPAARIQYSHPANTAVCRQTDKNKVNCATVALKSAAAKFGKNPSDKKLASLVSKSGNQTSLLAMKKFVGSLGLYCTAVNTDLQSLKNLKDCQVIVHVPGKNHFVVLDELNKDAKAADLSKYSALLISDKPFAKQFAAIPNAKLSTIDGAGYSCTRVLQQAGYLTCLPPSCDQVCTCDGGTTIYALVKGCAYAPSGTCSSTYMLKSITYPCTYDPEIEGCKTTSEGTSAYMRACSSEF